MLLGGETNFDTLITVRLISEKRPIKVKGRPKRPGISHHVTLQVYFVPFLMANWVMYDKKGNLNFFFQVCCMHANLEMKYLLSGAK